MRPRKRDAHLPRRVYIIHGSYWFRPLKAKDILLCRVQDGLPAMHEALARELRNLESPNGSVAALVKDWKAKHVPTAAISGATRTTYERIADTISESLGAFRLDQLDTPAIQEFLDYWNDRPRMYNEVRKVARQLFSWGVQRGRLALDPAEKTTKKKLGKRDVYIPDEAFAEILLAMERDAAGRWDGAQETDRLGLKGGPGHKATHNGLMNRAFIELAYLTGQRAQEVRSLRWTDINDGYIYFKPTKTQGSSGAAVKIRVSGEIQRVLDSVKSFVAVRNEELVAMAAEEEAKGAKGRRTKRLPVPARSEYVIHRLDGKPFQQTGLRTAWRRAIALTEYKNSGYTIKDIRPKALTDAHEALDDIKQVQKMAAHTNLSTTTGYIRGRGRVAPKVESPLVVPKRSKSR